MAPLWRGLRGIDTVRGSDAACECAVYGAIFRGIEIMVHAIRIHQHGGRSDEVEEVDVGEPGRAGAPEARQWA